MNDELYIDLLSSSEKLTTSDGNPLSSEDESKFRSIVGALSVHDFNPA
jgi:hypothetical protein